LKEKAYVYSKRQLGLGYWIARRAPQWLRYFVILDAAAKATTGENSGKTPDDLTWKEIADCA